MDFFVTPTYLINVEQIAYVARTGANPTSIRVFFAAAAGANGETVPNILDLKGADADLLIQKITRKPSEELDVP